MMPEKLKKEIVDFCVLNEIANVDHFIAECVQTGFNIKKYGNKPDLAPIQTAPVKVDVSLPTGTTVTLQTPTEEKIQKLDFTKTRKDDDDDYFE